MHLVLLGNRYGVFIVFFMFGRGNGRVHMFFVFVASILRENCVQMSCQFDLPLADFIEFAHVLRIYIDVTILRAETMCESMSIANGGFH